MGLDWGSKFKGRKQISFLANSILKSINFLQLNLTEKYRKIIEETSPSACEALPRTPRQFGICTNLVGKTGSHCLYCLAGEGEKN